MHAAKEYSTVKEKDERTKISSGTKERILERKFHYTRFMHRLECHERPIDYHYALSHLAARTVLSHGLLKLASISPGVITIKFWEYVVFYFRITCVYCTVVFLRRFRDPIRVPRISNRVPRIRENYHWVPKIWENRVPRIREIRSLQIHTGYLTFSLKKPVVQWSPIITRWSGSKNAIVKQMISYGGTINEVNMPKADPTLFACSVHCQKFSFDLIGGIEVQKRKDHWFKFGPSADRTQSTALSGRNDRSNSCGGLKALSSNSHTIKSSLLEIE